MNRSRRSGLPLFALAAAALLLVSCRKEASVPDGERAAKPLAASFSLAGQAQERETTIRNVCDKPVVYQLRPFGTVEWQPERTVAPGAIDRIPGRVSLEIRFSNGVETLSYLLESGQPYSFRYDDENRVQVFLGSHGRADAVDLAPYVPTPLFLVKEMLKAAAAGPADVVYDIGCGDGRIVVAAARDFGARAVGIDLDAGLLRQAADNARAAGVSDRVRFLNEDATRADLRAATVVTLYLLPESNEMLRPALETQLRPGARVVTHNYPVPGWAGTEAAKLTFRDGEGNEHLVFLYRR